MIFSLVPFWLPLIWAIAIAIYWNYLWKEPLNHWMICLLVFAINFFFFAWAFIIFLIVAIVKSGILQKLMKNKTENEPK